MKNPFKKWFGKEENAVVLTGKFNVSYGKVPDDVPSHSVPESMLQTARFTDPEDVDKLRSVGTKVPRIVIPEYESLTGGDLFLGRHIRHDPRSKAFPTSLAVPSQTPRSVMWKRNVNAYDQGNIGSCVPNTGAGAMSTQPYPHKYHEGTARLWYRLITKMDDIPGYYPEEDTGSDGLSLAKFLLSKGLIDSYTHAFSVEDKILGLQAGPDANGINWYDSFDQPDANGLVTISADAQVRGGHEIEGVEYIQKTPGTVSGEDLFGFYNSWSTSWGQRGKFWMTVSTFDRLMHEQGDVTQFHRNSVLPSTLTIVK